jgi:hypothetical protein
MGAVPLPATSSKRQRGYPFPLLAVPASAGAALEGADNRPCLLVSFRTMRGDPIASFRGQGSATAAATTAGREEAQETQEQPRRKRSSSQNRRQWPQGQLRQNSAGASSLGAIGGTLAEAQKNTGYSRSRLTPQAVSPQHGPASRTMAPGDGVARTEEQRCQRTKVSGSISLPTIILPDNFSLA